MKSIKTQTRIKLLIRRVLGESVPEPRNDHFI